jgi:hypothetical protein
MASLILYQTFAMIRPIHLSHRAESLAWWTADNDIYLIRTDQLRQLGRSETSQIFVQNVRDLRQVFLENSNGFRIEINGDKPYQSSPFQAEAKAATTAK